MPLRAKDNHLVLLLIVGLLGWLIPGAGHFIIKEKARAVIIFVAIVLTFGLEHQVRSPRITESVEPCPDRWTHHMIISSPADIDDEVMGWLQQAYAIKSGKAFAGRQLAGDIEQPFPAFQPGPGNGNVKYTAP